MDTCICMAESLCCPLESISVLLTGYTPVQNKKSKKRKNSKVQRYLVREKKQRARKFLELSIRNLGFLQLSTAGEGGMLVMAQGE